MFDKGLEGRTRRGETYPHFIGRKGTRRRVYVLCHVAVRRLWVSWGIASDCVSAVCKDHVSYKNTAYSTRTVG